MDFGWVAIAMGEIAWIALAFAFGMLVRGFGLPSLVGFLAAGFVLNALGVSGEGLLGKLADLGITLLLFTVGLKLNLGLLTRPQVWAVTCLHMAIVITLFGSVLYGLAIAQAWVFADLTLHTSLLIAFALSFSSTVFVVKVLEERGDISSLHGRIAVGILLMQDVAAVAFLAFSTGKVPTVWALLLLGLIPLRPVLHRILRQIGHGELLVLYGFLLALGGAKIFEMVGVKGDLGAIVLGVLIANNPKSEEMAKTMLGFKNLFLLAFFLSVGLAGDFTLETVLLGAMLTPLIFMKSVLFGALLLKFRLRARTSMLAAINLGNYSEFGLIVITIAVSKGWLESHWLISMAIALSLSFALAAGLNRFSESLFARNRGVWQKWQRHDLIADDRPHDLRGATIAVIGMGGVGTGAYDTIGERFGDVVMGVDIDPITARNQQALGRNVMHGDPSDADFWDRVQASHSLSLIMIALPRQTTTLAVLHQLKNASFSGHIAATARFADEEAALREAGVTTVFNMYTEAGVGFATHVGDAVSANS